MLGTFSISSYEGQVNGAFELGAQFALCLFSGFFEALVSHGVVTKVDSLCLFEFVGEVIYEYRIQIVTTEMCITIGAEDLEDVVANIEDRNIEGTSAEVEDGDLFVLFPFKPVGKCRGGGFVDNALDLEASDFSGVFCGLSLGVVEVGRDGNDSAGNRFAKVILGGLFQVLQNHSRDFGRCVFLASNIDFNQFIRGAGYLIRDGFFFR